MIPLTKGNASNGTAGAPGPFSNATVLLLALGVLLAAYGATTVSLAHIWNTSDTYAHGWLIPPISAYLLYQMRDELARVPIRLCWPALLPMAVAGAVWMLAFLGDVQVVQQLMLVTLLLGFTLFMMGWEWCRSAAFPLGFLYLAVPLGDGLTPHLIDMTADFVVHALRLTGIPVYREGTQFVIPSGTWSVVSGCSGMRYLMATITVGVLFAYLNYRSIMRRVAFVGVAIGVAIVANWLRAYGIVMIAHLSDMKLALGVDHYVYGWVFFGIVIFLLMTIGMIWSEAPAAAVPATAPSTPAAGVQRAARAPLPAVFAGLLLVLIWPWLASLASRPVPHPAPALDTGVPVLTTAWQRSEPPDYGWTPHYVGTPHIFEEAFSDATSTVGVYVAWFGQQSQGEELIHAANQLVHEKYEPWRLLAAVRQRRTAAIGRHFVESVLVERAGEGRILVWEFNWVGGTFTSGKLTGKIMEVRSRLLGNGNPAASVLLYTRLQADETEGSGRTRLEALAAAELPRLDAAFARAMSAER